MNFRSQLIDTIKYHNIECLYLSVGKVTGLDTGTNQLTRILSFFVSP